MSVVSFLVLRFRRRLNLGTLVHIVYWAAIVYIWSAQAFGEGLAAPHEAAMHFWFVTTAATVMFVFLDRSTTAMYVYVAFAVASFVICEFALVTAAPLVELEPALRRTIGGVNATFAMVATVSVAYLFSRDLANAQS